MYLISKYCFFLNKFEKCLINAWHKCLVNLGMSDLFANDMESNGEEYNNTFSLNKQTHNLLKY